MGLERARASRERMRSASVAAAALECEAAVTQAAAVTALSSDWRPTDAASAPACLGGGRMSPPPHPGARPPPAGPHCGLPVHRSPLIFLLIHGHTTLLYSKSLDPWTMDTLLYSDSL
eukprot:scaffold211318_cov33-Tisochrysis_lutea.AAC.1